VPVDRPDTRSPIPFAGGLLDRYRHVCAFVSSGDDRDAVLDPFLAEGVDAGDRLLFLVDPHEAAAPVRRLRHLGFRTGDLLAADRCEVRTWDETYLRGGGFDPEAMLGLLRELLAEQDGVRVRMLADMGWAVDGRGDEDLIEFESRANFIHARHPHAVVCLYDLARFSGAFVIDVLRTHPVVLIHGALHENPFFVPPTELLRERAQRTRR
jgi:hypothetical protein